MIPGSKYCEVCMKQNYKCSCGYEAKYGDMIMIQIIKFGRNSWKCPNCKTINYPKLDFKPETIKKELYPEQNEAKKYDNEKLMWDSLPWTAVELAARVMHFGAKKYNKHNYLNGNGLEDWRYFNAMMRHVMAHRNGELSDPESGLPHLSHAVCCLLMWQETLIKNEKEQFKWAK